MKTKLVTLLFILLIVSVSLVNAQVNPQSRNCWRLNNSPIFVWGGSWPHDFGPYSLYAGEWITIHTGGVSWSEVTIEELNSGTIIVTGAVVGNTGVTANYEIPANGFYEFRVSHLEFDPGTSATITCHPAHEEVQKIKA